MMNHSAEIAEVARLLEDLHQRKFYGEVLVKFESGRVITLKKTETLKPGHLAWDHHRENRGKQDERNQ